MIVISSSSKVFYLWYENTAWIYPAGRALGPKFNSGHLTCEPVDLFFT
jgi:hypothetical protein